MASLAELFDLAASYQQNGEWRQAELLYRQILDADPARADVHTNLAMALHADGRSQEALVFFARAAGLNPHEPEAHVNLGNALKEQGKLEEAARCYGEALRINPDLPQAHNNLGNALRDQGRRAEAIECYRRALRIQPHYASAHFNLGMAFTDQQRAADAAECFRQALRIDPQFANGYYYLGNALKDQGKFGEAIACYRQAIRIDPAHANAHHNLGTILTDQGELAEAALCYRQALRIDPRHVDARSNLGVLLYKQGSYAESAAQFDQALRLDPNHVGARFNRSMLWLLTGNFDKGWPEYEFRDRQPMADQRNFTQPRWQGEPLAGKTILLHAEQGMGDTVQFIRFAARVKQQGGTVLFESQPALLPILGGVTGVDQLLPRGRPLPMFDVQAPLLSLPGIFHTTLDTIPADMPYLRANPDRVQYWQKELACIPECNPPGVQASAAFKVGIAWQGNPKNKDDSNRSLPLNQFETLARLTEVSLLSLQVGPGSEQVAAAPFPIVDLGQRFDPHSLEDLAAVLMNLDLVVTVDSVVAHVAGALGVPVWVLLRFSADWRWLLERADSPWYPTMRLFRQQRAGDWPHVLERVKEELQLGIEERGRGQAAIAVIRREVALNPANAAAYFKLGAMLMSQGQAAEAIACYRQVLRLDPHHDGAHNNLGNALKNQDQVAEAVECYRQALRCNPNNANAHFNLGNAVKDQGRADGSGGLLPASRSPGILTIRVRVTTWTPLRMPT